MRKVFTGLAMLLVLIIAAQFYFAASGAFNGARDNDAYRPHHVLGYVIFILPLVMALVGMLAKMPRRLIGLTALVALLDSIQVLLGALSNALNASAGHILFGLHAINAMAIIAVAVTVLRQSRALPQAAATLDADPRP